MSRGHNKQPIPIDKNRPKAGEWDTLNAIYAALLDYAIKPTEVAGMIRNPDVVSKISDMDTLLSRVKMLSGDCGQLSQQLLSIYKRHSTRTGQLTSSDDRFESLDIYGQYIEWAERYEQVVYPVYLSIVEQIGQVVGVDIMAIRPSDLEVFQDKGDVNA